MENSLNVIHLYEETKSIAEELVRIKFCNKISDFVRKHDISKIEEIFEQFKTENPELWQRFCKINEIYSEEVEEAIFVDTDTTDEEFSKEMIFHFTTLLILSNCKMKFLNKEEGIEDTEDVYLNTLEDLIEIFI